MNSLVFVPALMGLAITLAVLTAGRLLLWARAPQNLAGAFLLLTMAANLTGYLFQLVQADWPAMVAWQQVEVIGLNLMYPAWLVFVLYFTGQDRRVTPALLAGLLLLSAFPIVTSLLPATRAAFVQVQGVVEVGGLHVLKQQLGWVVPVTAVFAQVEGIVGSLFLVRPLRRVRPGYHGLVAILLLSQTFAYIALWLEITGANPIAPLSIFNLSIIPTCIAVSWAIFALRVGQTLPAMHERVLETMHDSVLILDAGLRAGYFNPAARRLFELPPGPLKAQPLAQLAPELARHLAAQQTRLEKTSDAIIIGEMVFSLSRSAIQDWKGDIVGQVLVLRNVTERERLEQKLEVRAIDLARSSAFTQALSQLAARVAASADVEQVYHTLRDELHRLGLEFCVGRRRPGESGYALEYLSVEHKVVQILERFFGMQAVGFPLPEMGAVPDPDAVEEAGAIFIPDLMATLHRVFPMFPESFEEMLLDVVGMSLHIPSLSFRLVAQGEDIGLLAIWGASLRREDLSPLSTFAAQVSAAIQKAHLIRSEHERVVELERTTQLILSLIQVAARFEANLSRAQILETLGAELRHLGATCLVTSLDPATNELVGDYTSVAPAIQRIGQQLTGLSLATFRFPYPAWQALAPEATGLANVVVNPASYAQKILPDVPPLFIQRGLELLGVSPQSPAVWLPLRASGRLMGILALWGIPEPQRHLTVFSLFATQVATALEKARLMADLETLKSFNEGIVQGVAEGIVLINMERQIIFANPAAGQLVGLPPAALTGQSWLHFLLPDDQAKVRALLAASPDGRVIGLEVMIKNQAGEMIPVLANLQTLVPAGQPASTLVSFIDIRQRIQAEQQIRASIQEKEALLKEIHHRVKNNLQIISSLLNLQASRIKDAAMIDAFRESQNRVRSMALIHEKLYRSDNLARIRLDEYLRELTHFLLRTYQETARQVRLEIIADPVNLDIDTAIPCGLIINELVTNALKHAFVAQPPAGGRLTLRLTLLPEARVRLEVEDNGPGFPANLDERRTSSLGLQLVTSLTRQLAGEVTFTSQPGAKVELAFTSPGAYLSSRAPERAVAPEAPPP